MALERCQEGVVDSWKGDRHRSVVVGYCWEKKGVGIGVLSQVAS